MKNIKIIFLATGHYYVRFNDFLNSIKTFYPNDHKTIILLSNVHEKKYDNYDEDNVSIKFTMIDHFPWPIITLFKMHFVKEYISPDDDFIFFINSNMLTFEGYDNQDLLCEDRFIAYRFIKEGYYSTWNDYNPFNNQIKYVQGGLWGGKYPAVYKMCEWVSNRINENLLHNKIERLHDETALNAYIASCDPNEYDIRNADEIFYRNEPYQSGLDRDNKIATENYILKRYEL